MFLRTGNSLVVARPLRPPLCRPLRADYGADRRGVPSRQARVESREPGEPLTKARARSRWPHYFLAESTPVRPPLSPPRKPKYLVWWESLARSYNSSCVQDVLSHTLLFLLLVVAAYRIGFTQCLFIP
jgi:hypothetical protein